MIHTRIDRRQIGLVLIAALVVLAGCAGMGGNGAESSGAPQQQSADDSAQLSGGGSSDGSGGGVGSYYTDDGDRVVVREADMDLRVDNFSRAFQRLRVIAERNDGYLGDRSQDSRGEWDRGTITVRVPPEQFASTRDAIASLGHLENEDVRVKDFTSEYEDREERIRQLEQEERSLERLLNETDDVDEAERVRRQLSDVRGEIRDLQSRQQSLQQRQAMSTIVVDMSEPESEQPPKNYESAFGFYDAFLEAFYGGLTALKYVIVFFGYAIPVGLALIPLGAFGVGVLAAWRRTTRFVAGLISSDGGDGSGDGLGVIGAENGGSSQPASRPEPESAERRGEADDVTDGTDDSETTADEGPE